MTISRKASLQVWFPASVLLLVTVPYLTGGFGPSERVPVSTHDGAGKGVASASPPPELVWLPAGTRFTDRRPAEGWSNVVLKSTPTLASGDLGTLSKEAFVTARRIRLAILADVEPSSKEGPYRLGKVGLGLSAPVVAEGAEAGEPGEVVVTTSNVGDESGEWSTKERIILAAGSRELGRATLAAATSTFALLKLPTTYLAGDEHETVDVLYAILVDPASGDLRLFVCKPGVAGTAPIVREPTAPAIVDGPLHVKARTLAGIPISWSFAMTDLPGGAEREVVVGLAGLLAPDGLDALDARTVEGAFRSLADLPSIARASASTSAQGD